ncbi:sigma-70 family RNA polymerase sigma factor [Microcoleus sp. FACHB-SPT15]|uniref:RNA polymerase sigma factor n=1 Tax=Microcoleus sp. FACHB-SPT15 TaxID=2692830 RepID=UPI0017834C3B|nr:sigma-70 family RNA polymerase sigma factor [Microcoleus sp. FACHB-SPT15]MBD1806294.1 sigma-70 family RNA polymerase sigma factor [Microcoleus sp. FACHB-SPT15]
MNKSDNQGLDEQLKQLAIEAQSYQPGAKQRQLALTKLVKGIMRSPKLYRPPPHQLPPNFVGAYKEIYDEAKQELMLHICQNINEYDAERGSVLTWVNLLMGRRFFNKAISMFRDRRDQRVLNPIPSLDDLDTFEPDEFISPEKSSEIDDLQHYIEEDPEGIFKQHCIREHPQANFQFLLLQRLADKSWQEISEETQIPVPTLSTFYQRSMKKFASKLKDYILA